ncbi:UNVERIFIED_CONTAM: hypothetical protein FKN15_037431 [Acipenser sinensis]
MYLLVHILKHAPKYDYSTDDLNSLCLFCGEQNTLGDAVSQDEWIACDGCNRWFLHTRVAQPSTKRNVSSDGPP